jgi:hypothetical protein
MGRKSKAKAIRRNGGQKPSQVRGDRLYAVSIISTVVNSRVSCMVFNKEARESVALVFRLVNDKNKLYAHAEVTVELLARYNWIRDINTISPIVCQAVLTDSSVVAG